MRIKFVIIYAAAGVAFLAVSLWAFLSNGRSARAVRYKYKLGGIMLTAWAMLSAASCEGIPPLVTCYEPVVECYDVAAPTNEPWLEVKGYGGNKLKSGDVLSVKVSDPTFEKYRIRIVTQPPTGESVEIQTADFAVTDGVAAAEITLAATDYKGSAMVCFLGIGQTEAGSEKENSIGGILIEII